MPEWDKILSNPEKFKKWKEAAVFLDKNIKCFLEFDPEKGIKLSGTGAPADRPETEPADKPLSGIPFAVKDNIAVKSFKLTCGSKILSNFVSPYTATAVTKLQNNGAVVIGKTNLDEFGMGSSTENSAFSPTHNPWDVKRVPGGSSGGSAAAVAAGLVPFALGSDTGGSIRQPASFCGVYGLKPTYGSVSRFGLVAYASSLEVIGIISKTVSMLKNVFNVMKGEDPLDHSSLPAEEKTPAGKTAKIGLPKELKSIELYPSVRKTLDSTIRNYKQMGYAISEISLPTLEYVVSAYYVIATAEASANLARFDGIRYGERDFSAENPEELMLSSRNRGFGKEVKLRILLGTYVLRSGFQEQYYLRAQKIRTAIRKDLQKAFESVDAVLLPVYPRPAFKPGSKEMDPFSQKLADIFTSTANLAGIPAVSFPAAVEEGLPVGMQLLAPPFAEKLLFSMCRDYEKVFPSPNPPDNYFNRSI
ncbi:MAG: Asp-tRNA(Asn)/Glu-tRNA(Gln) amidotransferase subunit GatA [Spirochaetes bacterium]|nr:Asp-tRNA(Asn)/Glu-tRNA(Gln) amidotransferase subunit GatA [Spirochaetota bacterium]